jgi:integrase
MPVDLTLEKILREHRGRQPQSSQGCEWVNATHPAGVPWRAWSAQRRSLVRAEKKVGNVRLGWHGFPHTYSTLLNEYGTDAKVQQELLRHADVLTTMNIYTTPVPERLSKAGRKVVRLVLPTDA